MSDYIYKNVEPRIEQAFRLAAYRHATMGWRCLNHTLASYGILNHLRIMNGIKN
jgi:hypothetical protein